MDEPRNKQVAAAVSATEKDLINLAAEAEGSTVSELLRSNSLTQLIEKGQRIADRVRKMDLGKTQAPPIAA